MRQQKYCDTCGKMRNDVVSMGRDANGDPDAPDMCFLCRVEGTRGRSWSFKQSKYMNDYYSTYDE